MNVKDKTNKRIAIVPGSFDPITNGHISLVKRALEDHDIVYLAVMINSSKKYMFTLEERERIAKAALACNDNVIVISSDGMLWELAKNLNAISIVKGYRNEKDLAYEKEMAKFNEEHYPDAKTVLLKAEEEMCNLSSTMIRELINRTESLQQYLPHSAEEEIKKIISKK